MDIFKYFPNGLLIGERKERITTLQDVVFDDGYPMEDKMEVTELVKKFQELQERSDLWVMVSTGLIGFLVAVIIALVVYGIQIL